MNDKNKTATLLAMIEGNMAGLDLGGLEALEDMVQAHIRMARRSKKAEAMAQIKELAALVGMTPREVLKFNEGKAKPVSLIAVHSGCNCESGKCQAVKASACWDWAKRNSNR